MGTIKDDVTVYDPINTNKNVYYSRVMYKDSEISLQVSKCKMSLNKDKNKAKLNVDRDTADFIKSLSKAVVEITAEKSEDFFGKEISVEDCETIYKDALVEDILHCFYDDDTYFYESKESNVEISDLPDTLDGIALLKCSAVVYTKHSFFIRWEISQFKIKKPKRPRESSMIEEYIIKDLPDHDMPTEGDPLAKKLDELCLF